MSRQVRNLDGEGFCHLQPGLPWTRGLAKSEMPGVGTEVASRAGSAGTDVMGGHHGSGLWGEVSFRQHLNLSSAPTPHWAQKLGVGVLTQSSGKPGNH